MPWDFAVILVPLGVIVPLRGRAKIRKLLDAPQISSVERISLYASTIVFQWLLAAVTAWRAWARGLSPVHFGIATLDSRRIAAAAVAGAILFVVLQWLTLRRAARFAGPRGTLFRFARLIYPQTAVEKLAFTALAATAGLCEEFLYRGFAMAAFSGLGIPLWAVVLATAALFALAHLYQGRTGVLTTLTVGLLFGAARVAYDSIAPVVVWHTAVDLTGGFLGRRYFNDPPSGVSS